MLSSSMKEVLTIGIFGSNGKTSTSCLLSSIFNSAGLLVGILGNENNVEHKEIMPNYDVYKRLKNMGNYDIIIIEITEELLRSDKLNNIEFDMLVHCNISEGSYEYSPEGIDKLNSIINYSHKIKTLLLNTDDINWKRILNINESYLITYGLGNKATVTASSIECSKNIRLCYCLQRALTNYKNEIIMPMEVPLKLNVIGQYNVYNGLAAVTAALVYGIQIDSIILALNSSMITNCGLQMVCENGFGIAYNISNTIVSFETGFEAVQNLPYENIHLVFSLKPNNSSSTNKKVLEIIGTWSLILKLKKIYFLNYKGRDGGLKVLNKIRTNVTGATIEAVSSNNHLDRIETIINSLKEKDILLFFCSSDLNHIRGNIVEILDKRILGSLSGDIA